MINIILSITNLLLLYARSVTTAPVILLNDYQQASFAIDVINCLLQLAEVIMVLTFAVYKIRQ
ncbi:hypothetical protein [Clostera anachoreta granulovirus]|uniref:Uncharacterized protein n=2 Tax=Betabaculovirus TaxID=558017 RepID=Q6BD74_9BBAC|nr:hypothetical protein ClanGV_gp114 [Clostera anachoreta granulovirus]YP_008720061.1 hypothetical protein CaLGV114 [Clostera anastomosis granulovirus Henan]AAT77800.1 unknown [Clostera anachoreta granulovirus]AEB00402.1 hypothetical protein [Clostera anachoreta granulovirus]AGQ20372.1 hypothetical protein CaLGV114 [Clostera anastomosis granulovirus Henan]